MPDKLDILKAMARCLADHGDSEAEAVPVAVGRLLLRCLDGDDPVRRAAETFDQIEDLVDSLRRELVLEPGPLRRVTEIRGVIQVSGRGLVVLVDRPFGSEVPEGTVVRIGGRAKAMVTEVSAPPVGGALAGLFLKGVVADDVRIGDTLEVRTLHSPDATIPDA
jgi:hypothetical protein